MIGCSHPRYWFVKQEAGGGPMFDLGCHRIELLLHLPGPLRRVSGMPHGNRALSSYGCSLAIAAMISSATC